MRIAWHMPTLRTHTCGLSLRAIAFASRLCEQGDSVTFFVDAAKTDAASDAIRGMALRRLDIPFARPLQWSLQAMARRRRAFEAVESVGDAWDLVISCQPEFVAAYGKRRDRAPLLYVCGSVTLHHDAANAAGQAALGHIARLPFAIDRALKRANERRAFLAADAAVFDSDQTRSLVIKTYGVSADKCHTIRGGVDASRFSPVDAERKASARRSLNISDKFRVVTWTGRMSPEKNLPLLLDAAARMRGEDVLFLLVGDGPERSTLEERAASLGLKDRVRFVGACSDVRPHLRAADVFAFPSRSESFGCSMAEALACGLPVVALRPGGDTIRNASIEVVEDGECGLLADEPTAAAFASQLKRLLENAELRERLSCAARTWAMRYDWNDGVSRLREVIGTLVPDRSTAAECIRVNPRSAEVSSPVVV